MHIEAFLIFSGIFLAVASLVHMRNESAAARRRRRTPRRLVVPKSRRGIVGAAGGR